MHENAAAELELSAWNPHVRDRPSPLLNKDHPEMPSKHAFALGGRISQKIKAPFETIAPEISGSGAPGCTRLVERRAPANPTPPRKTAAPRPPSPRSHQESHMAMDSTLKLDPSCVFFNDSVLSYTSMGPPTLSTPWAARPTSSWSARHGARANLAGLRRGPRGSPKRRPRPGHTSCRARTASRSFRTGRRARTTHSRRRGAGARRPSGRRVES